MSTLQKDSLIDLKCLLYCTLQLNALPMCDADDSDETDDTDMGGRCVGHGGGGTCPPPPVFWALM